MKKSLISMSLILAVFAFLVNCGGDSANDLKGRESVADKGKLGEECYPNETCNKGLICDTENNVCIEDPTDTNSDNTDSSSDGKTDTGYDSDSDSGNSRPDNDADTGVSEPDSEEPEPINENPDNLPECSQTSTMPCIDSQVLDADSEKANLIWSEKAPYRMRWIDAVDYCNNLNEGGYSATG